MDHSVESGLKEVLGGLRVALENGAMYSTEHSVFLKSLEQLKKALDVSLAAFRSIEILVSPTSLIIDEITFEHDPAHEQLARFLHIRSIKSITFERGVDADEIKCVLAVLSLPATHLMHEGGALRLLEGKPVRHITLTGLDYSDILNSTKEDADVWGYLLRKALDTNNPEEIQALTDNFERMLRSVEIDRLFKPGDFRKGVEDFLIRLEETNEPAFIQCGRSLCETLMRQTGRPGGVPLSESLTASIQALNARDLADVIARYALAPEASVLPAFEWYAEILRPESHEAVALFLEETIDTRAVPQINLVWLNAMTEALFPSENQVVRDVYAPVFTRYKKIFADEDTFHFNADAIPEHYRAALLGLFLAENSADGLRLIIDQLLPEWEGLPDEAKPAAYQALWEKRIHKQHGDPSLESVLAAVDACVTRYVETAVLAGQEGKELDALVQLFRQGTMNPDLYLDKIFNDRDFRPVVMKALLTFYPEAQALLTRRLADHLSDTPFLLKLIESLKGLTDALAVEILKDIFASPNPYIKSEVVQRMSKIRAYDPAFLLGVLSGRGHPAAVREGALRILMQEGSLRAKAAEVLLSPSGPFAGHHESLIENIRMAGRVGLAEARPFIERYRTSSFLWWNQRLSREAATVLEQKPHGDH